MPLHLSPAPTWANACAVFSIAARCIIIACAFVLASCATKDRKHYVRVSVADQKMLVFRDGMEIDRYDVSTSKFGVGSRSGSNATPLGMMEVAKKIGRGARPGMKFKGRRPTGEIVRPNSPGRDPIVTRILWLRGLESQNRNTFSRCIYIHGTPEEWRIGTPASYGCIRMRSRDVVDLFNTIGVGARVEVTISPFPQQIVRTALPPPPPPAPILAPPPPPSTPLPPPPQVSAQLSPRPVAPAPPVSRATMPQRRAPDGTVYAPGVY